MDADAAASKEWTLNEAQSAIMVVEERNLFIIREGDSGYKLNHIYVDEESAQLALRNFFTPTKVQQGQIWIERIAAKKMQHCCEM